MTRKIDEDQSEVWYLDSCASRHICNSKEKFAELWPKTYKFVTAGGIIIKSNQVRTIILFLINEIQLTLSNIIFAPECDSNLISLGQLQETGISYHDYSEQMLLRQAEKTIGLTTRKRNLFIRDIQIHSRKMILVKDRGRPIYLLSKNPQIRLWHRKLGHASNTRVVETSKLNNKIDIIIENDFLTKNLSSNSGMDDKDKCKNMGQNLIVNNKHEKLPLLKAIINKTDSSEIEKLCNTCIESKHIKIIRYKKMILTTRKLQKIHVDL